MGDQERRTSSAAAGRAESQRLLDGQNMPDSKTP